MGQLNPGWVRVKDDEEDFFNQERLDAENSKLQEQVSLFEKKVKSKKEKIKGLTSEYGEKSKECEAFRQKVVELEKQLIIVQQQNQGAIQHQSGGRDNAPPPQSRQQSIQQTFQDVANKQAIQNALPVIDRPRSFARVFPGNADAEIK